MVDLGRGPSLPVPSMTEGFIFHFHLRRQEYTTTRAHSEAGIVPQTRQS